MAQKTKKIKIDRKPLQIIGVMSKDWKESWNSREMNAEAKSVGKGSWTELTTGGDFDVMVYMPDKIQANLNPKDDGYADFFTLGDPFFDPKKKDFAIIVEDPDGNEHLVHYAKGDGNEAAWDIVNGSTTNEAKTLKHVPILESFSSVLKRTLIKEDNTNDWKETQDGHMCLSVDQGRFKEGEFTIIPTSDDDFELLWSVGSKDTKVDYGIKSVEDAKEIAERYAEEHLGIKNLYEAKVPPGAMTLSKLTKKLEEVGYRDELSKKDDHYIARRGYFYSNNGSKEKFEQYVKSKLEDAGLKFKILNSGDKWKAFKGGAKTKDQSHWWVEFSVENEQPAGTTNEAKDSTGAEISIDDKVKITGDVEMKGKKGVVGDNPSGFVVVTINGKNYSFHASDVTLANEPVFRGKVKEAKGGIPHFYVVDLDERGEFEAHVEDVKGNVVWSVDTEGMRELIDDGFMKHTTDVDGLEEHLKEVGIIEDEDTLDDGPNPGEMEDEDEEDLDESIQNFIDNINEDFGDDDKLALDNSEPEYEVIVDTKSPIQKNVVQKIVQKLGITGSHDLGFIIKTKVLLKKFVNTLRGFDVAVSKIIDAHDNEIDVASIQPYKQVGRPTNKYNYPNRMYDAKQVNEMTVVPDLIFTAIMDKYKLSDVLKRNLRNVVDAGGSEAVDAIAAIVGVKKSTIERMISGIRGFKDWAKGKALNEAFREGTASRFDASLKEWAKKYGVEYEWKFKDVGKRKHVSYFVLKLNFEGYEALGNEAITALNGLLQSYGVDFSYKNRRWTPVIEAAVINEERLISGSKLTPEQKKHVLAAYIYRNTKENESRVKGMLKDRANGMKFDQTDDEWVNSHAFWFKNDGTPSSRKKYAEPASMVDEAKEEKKFSIKKTYRDREKIQTGTLAELIEYFGYTLINGNSHNPKIPKQPKNIKALVKALNDAVSETQGGSYNPDYYELVDNPEPAPEPAKV